MWGWLGSLIGFFSGGLQKIWDTFINVIRTLDGWVERQLSYLNGRCNALYVGIWDMSFYIANFIHQSYVPNIQRIDNNVRNTQLREHADYVQLVNAINTDRQWTSGQLARLAAYALSLFTGLIKWVLSAVFGPLSRDIARALAWIGKEGAYVFDLLTHLDKLANLLIAFLWTGWLALFRRYAKPVVAYIIQHIRGLVPEFLAVMEDIIATLL